MNLCRKIVVISRYTNKYCEYGAVAFLVMMLLLVALQVVARYGFDEPPQWTEEGARYCMIWMGLLGATVSYYKREDPVLFTPSEEFLVKWRVPIKLVEFLAVVVFVLPIMYYGPSFVMRQAGRMTDTLGIDVGYTVLIIPLFSIIILVHATARLISTDKDEAHYTKEFY
ncbi:MAG: hypothetical protein COB36_14470 [Alphaproteobacteria bacterium]|nr:MAG: hypothetical protein COB36_14470 [Alphaproteobacteria bacterium]